MANLSLTTTSTGLKQRNIGARTRSMTKEAQDNAENVTANNEDSESARESRSKTPSHRSLSSHLLHQTSTEWKNPLFVPKWARLPKDFDKYTLRELIDDYDRLLGRKDSETDLTCSKDAFVLCNWLTNHFCRSKHNIKHPLSADVIYKEGKKEEGVVYYLVDHHEFSPISQVLEPLSFTHCHYGVGLVLNTLLVLCVEINSSSMEGTVAKLAANLIDLFRYVRHFDKDITQIVGFAFPNSKEKDYVSKVTLEWQNLKFHVKEVIFPLEEKLNLITEVTNAYRVQCLLAEKLKLVHKDLPHYLVPYSDEDIQILKASLMECWKRKSQWKVEDLTQEESGFSLLFTDGTFYYKFTPYSYARDTLTSLKEMASLSDRLVLPCNMLTVTGMNFFVFPKQDYQLTMLKREKLLSCFYFVASGVKDALEELHTLGYAHLDVRLDNICFHQGKVTLIDFDFAESCDLPDAARTGFMYSIDEERPNSCVSDLDWKQLGLMIYSILESKSQTKLTVDDVNELEKDSLVHHLVFNYRWEDDAAKRDLQMGAIVDAISATDE